MYSSSTAHAVIFGTGDGVHADHDQLRWARPTSRGTHRPGSRSTTCGRTACARPPTPTVSRCDCRSDAIQRGARVDAAAHQGGGTHGGVRLHGGAHAGAAGGGQGGRQQQAAKEGSHEREGEGPAVAHARRTLRTSSRKLPRRPPPRPEGRRRGQRRRGKSTLVGVLTGPASFLDDGRARAWRPPAS